jgi:WD40 repeat protein
VPNVPRDKTETKNARQTAGARPNGVFAVWDAATGRAVGTFQPHDDFPTGMALSADGARVAFCFDDGRVNVWNLHAGP